MATIENWLIPADVKCLVGGTTTQAIIASKQNPNVMLLHAEIDSAGTWKLNVYLEGSISGTFTAYAKTDVS